jgi:putative membrane protein
MSLAAAFAATSAAAADADADFVKAAASGGLMEVELGRHAMEHAESPRVRAFGERMASDHGRSHEALKAVAKREGLALPSAMSEEHRKAADELTKLRGRELDEAYMKAMVEDHEKDVEAFREQAEQGKSAVDRWAAETLPTLEAHLRQAKSVANDVTAEASGGGAPGTDAGRSLGGASALP